MPQLKMEQIRIANESYRLGQPVISDDAYDALMRACEVVMTKEVYTAFRVTLVDNGGTVTLPAHCGSLRKCTHGTDDFKNYVERTKPKEIIGAEKLDGMGFVAFYLDGVLTTVSTIGDGVTGEDITHNARHVVPNLISIKGMMEVRGELCITLSGLEATGYKNARNGVVGLMKASKSDFNKLQHARALVYQIFGSDESRLHQLNELQELGFETPRWRLFHVDNTTETELADYLAHIREFGEYLVDGIVINDVDVVPENVELPNWTVAFKVNADFVETTVRTMDIRTSKDGRLKGVAVLDPVELNGTTVENVSIYNFKYVIDNNIGAGSKVIICKAGEIIPKITEFLAPGYVDHSAHWELCPSCGSVTVVDGVDKRCINIECPAQKIKSVMHFLTNFDVLGAGETSLEKWGLTSIKNVLSFVPECRNGEKFLAEFTKKVFTASPANLLSRQNFSGAGRSSWDKLFEKHGYNLMITALLSGKRLANPSGVGDAFWDKVETSFIGALSNVHAIESDSRYAYEESIIESSLTTDSNHLNGKSFCFTGKLSKGRKELEKMVIDHSGILKSVSKNLDFLVVGEKAGSKKAKAGELGVKTLTETEFMEMI